VSLLSAAFHAEIADGPDDARAYWLNTSDDVRIRSVVWGGGTKGTVLLFPGRTEYIEKYGRAAADLLAHGFSTVAIDWRGQGLADRIQKNPNIGHVEDFRNYQKDLEAVLDALPEMDVSGPKFLLGHSMGGCIGLRSLMEGLDVKAAAFSAPMWGIAMGTPKRTAAWVVSTLARSIGAASGLAPGTVEKTYVLANPFEDNMLTTDPEMFGYMKSQVQAQPDLALGGPSLAWLNEGLKECRSLRMRPTPTVPTLTLLGTQERIVDVEAIHDRMARWPNGTLKIVEGSEHEVLMENKSTREAAIKSIAAHFETHS
jgi:lysophospholipase